MMHTLGSAITPLVARPFLVSSLHRATQQQSNVSSADWKAGGGDRTSEASVRTVYALVGTFDIVVAFVCLITSSPFPSDVVPSESPRARECQTRGSSLGFTPNVADRSPSHEPTQSASAKSSKTVLLTVVSLFFAVNGGRDALLNTLLFTYVEKYVGWTVTSGILLVTMYHVTRAVLHAVLVPLSHLLSPTRLMTFDVLALVGSSSCLTLAALLGRDLFTVVGVVVTGLATSNVHRTTIRLLDETTHGVVAPVMALFIVSIGVGQVVVAPLTGHLLQRFGAASFQATMLALAVADLALFCVYCSVLKREDTYRGCIAVDTANSLFSDPAPVPPCKIFPAAGRDTRYTAVENQLLALT